MKRVIDLLGDLATQDSGQDLLEYAFILGLMGLGAMVALKGLTNSVGTDFNNVGNVLTPSV
jgi:Flp pilus assembly pilin Flp